MPASTQSQGGHEYSLLTGNSVIVLLRNRHVECERDTRDDAGGGLRVGHGDSWKKFHTRASDDFSYTPLDSAHAHGGRRFQMPSSGHRLQRYYR